MKKYSIKTVDGNRQEFTDCRDITVILENPKARFIAFATDDGFKYFNIRNIVSITERNVDSE